METSKMTYEPTEELLAMLRDPVQAEPGVWGYLIGQFADALRYNKDVSPPEAFFKRDDLKEYEEARAWWPQVKLPPEHLFPTLFQLCFDYTAHSDVIGITFLERLHKRAVAVQNYVEREHPPRQGPAHVEGESAEDRKRRLALARQHKLRAKRRLTSSELDQIPAVAEAKAAYETALAAFTIADRNLDEARSSYQTAYQKAKADAKQ
jgi:hypothetical protein